MKKENLEVILEDMNSKFDIIIEGHQALDKKIDGVEERLSKKIDEVDAKVDFVHRSLTKRIDDVDLKIDRVEENLTGEIRAIGERLEDHEERIERLEKRT